MPYRVLHERLEQQRWHTHRHRGVVDLEAAADAVTEPRLDECQIGAQRLQLLAEGHLMPVSSSQRAAEQDGAADRDDRRVRGRVRYVAAEVEEPTRAPPSAVDRETPLEQERDRKEQCRREICRALLERAMHERPMHLSSEVVEVEVRE